MAKKRLADHQPASFAVLEVSVLGTPTVKSLGVTLTPFVQIYRNGNCVASFATGPVYNFAQKTGSTIDICLQRNEKEWTDFETEFAEPIANNRAVMERLLMDDDDEQDETNVVVEDKLDAATSTGDNKAIGP